MAVIPCVVVVLLVSDDALCDITAPIVPAPNVGPERRSLPLSFFAAVVVPFFNAKSGAKSRHDRFGFF
jgi:hypothetical protein